MHCPLGLVLFVGMLVSSEKTYNIGQKDCVVGSNSAIAGVAWLFFVFDLKC